MVGLPPRPEGEGQNTLVIPDGCPAKAGCKSGTHASTSAALENGSLIYARHKAGHPSGMTTENRIEILLPLDGNGGDQGQSEATVRLDDAGECRAEGVNPGGMSFFGRSLTPPRMRAVPLAHQGRGQSGTTPSPPRLHRDRSVRSGPGLRGCRRRVHRPLPAPAPRPRRS